MKKVFLCVRFMEDSYGSNVHAGLEKVFALWNACFRASALEKFCYVGFLRNYFMTNLCVRLREMSALENVRLREVPLYCNCLFSRL